MEENTSKIAALLDHLVHHNEHHAEEIHELADNAKQAGNDEAAALIKEGVTLMDQSNAKLREALKALTK
ncbi:MAG: hypothetical protein U0M15_07520 [Bacillota bacterium]|nr:hypothetical protein [Bacillota bacterium]